MFGSFRIGSVLGITIRVHVLLVLLVVVLIFSNQIELVGLCLLGLVLLLHELGHSLVARRFGIRVLDITLWPLGGMARMSAMPESSRTEACIAVAGPAVNFALAALAMPLLFIAGGMSGFVHELTLFFIRINLGLAIFNLIPVFPTDGGRILRALLASSCPWVVATERAVRVSRVIAAMLAVFGIVAGIWMLPVIALWLWMMGTAELASVRARHEGEPVASNAFGAEPARAPNRTPEHGDSPRTHAGFTDEDIARIEGFRGSLRHFERGP